MPSLPYRRNESPLTRRQKQLMAAVGALLVAVLAAALVWAQLRPGDYSRSENGCVNVLSPSSLGGMVLHQCGDQARTWCRTEYAAHDHLALLVQPQCRLAGITPEPSPAAGGSPDSTPGH